MTGTLIIVGGFIFVSMAIVHGSLSVIDVVRPTQFTPAEDSVRQAMKSTTVRFLGARATVWDAWLGFNISHSVGMLIFGAASIFLGMNIEYFAEPGPLLLVLATISVVYSVLSLRFWFYLPTASFAAALACFLVAWWQR